MGRAMSCAKKITRSMRCLVGCAIGCAVEGARPTGRVVHLGMQ